MPQYTKDELNHLYKRAKQGATTMDLGIDPAEEGLTNEELDQLAAELQTSDNFGYQYDIIEILRYGAVVQTDRYRHIISPFVHDSSHAQHVLHLLCDDWVLAPLYKHEMINFIRGVFCGAEEAYKSQYLQWFTLDLIWDVWHILNDPEIIREMIALYENPETEEITRLYITSNLSKITLAPNRSSDAIILQLARSLAEKLESRVIAHTNRA